MAKFCYIDTETVGLTGPICLIQYALDDGEVILYSPWKNTVSDTMKLIESFLEHDCLVFFNAAFDFFHLVQMYNVLNKLPYDEEPDITAYALAEADARNGLCLKPKNTLDLYLHAKKGSYQSLMEREPVRVKKVPRVLAPMIIEELEHRIKFKDVYFARKKDKKARWKIYDITDDLGDVIPDFVDLVLDFAPSSALKALVGDALGYEDITVFKDVELSESLRPVELGYAPFATAIGSPADWKGTWPAVIREHQIHWNWNVLAREYARKDVVYTRQLHYYFSAQAEGHSEEQSRLIARSEDIRSLNLLPGGDDDSILACMVGAIRWRGYEIDIPAMTKLRERATAKQAESRYNFNSTAVCRKYLSEVLTPTEALVMSKGDNVSTKGIILEEISKWHEEIVCEACGGMGCNLCDGGTVKSDTRHPAAIRAEEILDYRHAGKEIELYDKLLTAGRFHASFSIIGALSSRMSGADGLNPQGIKRSKEVRCCFPLAPPGMQLTGGDFSGFEVCLADAVYGDPDLRADLLTLRPCKKCAKAVKKGSLGTQVHWTNDKGDDTIITAIAGCDECKGTGFESTKIHALFGQFLFPPLTYDQIYDTKGLPGDQDKYSRSKNGVFALLYGGEAFTLVTRVGVAENVANEAYLRWTQRYKVWGEARKKIIDQFQTMKQEGSIGSKISWSEPAEYVESMLGFKRYFTLENMVAKALFQIAEDPPKEWYKLKMKVVRRDREQTPAGAVRSALFGCAFGIQSANMRAGANHIIQSSGAGITKSLQCKIWDLQPPGVKEWHVIPMNIHDEIMNPCKPEVVPLIQPIIDEFITKLRLMVPLAGIEWGNDLKSWADK